MKVLVVEDHLRLSDLIRRALVDNAYSVRIAASKAAANDALADESFDVVILDLGLPDGDGLDMLREWRLSGFNEPVIILSARNALADRVAGLDLGADDYLRKPFSAIELLARVRALVRRQSAVKLSVLEHRGLKLDLRTRVFELDGRPLALTSREIAILEIFMQNPGRVLPRMLISEKVWPSNFDIDMNLLDVYMSRLRGKLESGVGGSYFKTMRGLGYQLV